MNYGNMTFEELLVDASTREDPLLVEISRRLLSPGWDGSAVDRPMVLGKTISRVQDTDLGVMLVFTDSSYFTIEAESCCDGAGINIGRSLTHREKALYGLLSSAQMESYRQEQLRQEEERLKAELRDAVARVEELRSRLGCGCFQEG